MGVPAASVLNDPQLELYAQNGLLVATNDNWKDSQRPLIEGTVFQPTDDREPVILATLPPGNYTALVRGVNQTTGIGVVEIYDNDVSVDSDLGNISTRGVVQTEVDVMIAGWVLGNKPGPASIAVRGLGPSLTTSGITDVLVDPTLELRDSNAALLAANDDWESDAASAEELSSNNLDLPDPKESGIFMLLPPGQYTAIVRGVDGGIGVGLVEVYNVR